MTTILDLKDSSLYESHILLAASSLKDGNVIAFPTETVYGLAVNADDRAAVRRLCEVKNRPDGKPFTILVADKKDAGRYAANIPIVAERLIDHYWPGPLTIVMLDRSGGHVGLRMPLHRVAMDLLRVLDFPIVAPSANVSGQPAMTEANAIFRTFNGKIDLVMDYGRSPLGKASTVVLVNDHGARILRAGAISEGELFGFLGIAKK